MSETGNATAVPVDCAFEFDAPRFIDFGTEWKELSASNEVPVRNPVDNYVPTSNNTGPSGSIARGVGKRLRVDGVPGEGGDGSEDGTTGSWLADGSDATGRRVRRCSNSWFEYVHPLHEPPYIPTPAPALLSPRSLEEARRIREHRESSSASPIPSAEGFHPSTIGAVTGLHSNDVRPCGISGSNSTSVTMMSPTRAAPRLPISCSPAPKASIESPAMEIDDLEQSDPEIASLIQAHNRRLQHAAGTSSVASTPASATAQNSLRSPPLRDPPVPPSYADGQGTLHSSKLMGSGSTSLSASSTRPATTTTMHSSAPTRVPSAALSDTGTSDSIHQKYTHSVHSNQSTVSAATLFGRGGVANATNGQTQQAATHSTASTNPGSNRPNALVQSRSESLLSGDRKQFQPTRSTGLSDPGRRVMTPASTSNAASTLGNGPANSSARPQSASTQSMSHSIAQSLSLRRPAPQPPAAGTNMVATAAALGDRDINRSHITTTARAVVSFTSAPKKKLESKVTIPSENILEMDPSLEELLNQHNKKVKKTTYVPPTHSVRDVKKWEAASGKSWYDLSSAERESANEEIRQMKLIDNSSVS